VPPSTDKLTCFRVRFGIPKGLLEDELNSLLGDKRARAWNKGWTEESSLVMQLPDHWRDAGIEPEEWQQWLEIRSMRSKVRKEHADWMAAAKKDYEVKCLAAAVRLKNVLASTESPLVTIMEMGYDDLTLVQKLSVEREVGQTARTARIKALVAAARQTRIAAWRAGTWPPAQ